MKKKIKKNHTNSIITERKEKKGESYTIKELLDLGNKTNKIEIAPAIKKKM